MTSDTQAPATETTKVPTSAPQTGDEFLESLRDGREVWIYGERVKDVTTHPGFRNSARSLARLFDAMHDPAKSSILTTPTDTGSGGVTHPFFKYATSKDDLRKSRDAIRCWQEMGFGWLGRTPDYKAALMTGLGANPEYFGEYAGNARNWYNKAQENVLHIGHAIVHPPVDRDKGPEEVRDVYVHVERETDNGIIVSGAKVVATGSPLTQYVYVSHFGVPLGNKDFAVVFMAPINAPGVKLISRASYEEVASRTGSPFDYPLSSRFDENDAILIFDNALIPWENVLVYDVDTSNNVDQVNGRQNRALFQAATRLGVKLEFLAGLLSKALEITGAGSFRGVQAGLGEVIAISSVVNGLRDGMIENAQVGWSGSYNPNLEYGLAYAATAPTYYRRVREIIETVVASGLIYLNSNAIDFQTPEMRPYLDRFMRGSNGKTALDRSKTMKLMWDAIGSEFGARHELYELNYFGQPEANFIGSMKHAEQSGALDSMRKLATDCMEEYDLDGWKVPDLFNPGAFSAHRR